MTESEKKFLHNLTALSPSLGELYQLSQSFVSMFRSREVTQLHASMMAATTREFSFLRRFVKGLKVDYSAVRASLVFDWNNGQTEGQVNRLKFIKRQMYGRAKFDLLRLKVLHQG